MIVGIDEKVTWDDDGKTVLAAPGKDRPDRRSRQSRRSRRSWPACRLKNSVVGPPVNLDIDPTGSVALVPNSVDVVKDGDALKQVPDNKIFVIDMKANPPKLAATITGGKQPSGLSFSPTGKMALVANRADNSVSVLSVNGTDVKVTDTITFPDSVAHVMFTPDGKHALAVRVPGPQGVGARHRRRQGDLQQGRSADRPVALQRRGHAEQQDRADLGQRQLRRFRRQRRHHERDRPRSQPAAHHRSRRGRRRSGGARNVAQGRRCGGGDPARLQRNKKAFFYQKNGSLSILKIDGKKVTKTQDIEVGGLPEAVAFTPDGKYLLAGNYIDQDFSILKVNGTKVTDTGKRFKVPGIRRRRGWDISAE